MSGSEIIALAAVVVAGLSVLFNFWNASSERKQRRDESKAEHEEKYRSDLYAKRLAVHQEAFTWSQKLGRSAFFPGARHPAELIARLDEFRDWLESANLYLDPVSQHEVTKLLPTGRDFVVRKIEYSELTAQIDAAQSALVKGIGLKHIDFDAIKGDLRRMREESSAQ